MMLPMSASMSGMTVLRRDGGSAAMGALNLRLHGRAGERDHAGDRARLHRPGRNPHDPRPRREQQDAQIPRIASAWSPGRASWTNVVRLQHLVPTARYALVARR